MFQQYVLNEDRISTVKNGKSHNILKKTPGEKNLYN